MSAATTVSGTSGAPHPDAATRIETVEMHTGGEPVRIIVSGYPALNGATLLDKRREAKERFDHLRRGLMLEPRGHDGMYGALLVEPEGRRNQVARRVLAGVLGGLACLTRLDSAVLVGTWFVMVVVLGKKYGVIDRDP